MGKSFLLSPTLTPSKFCQKHTSILPRNYPKVSYFRSSNANLDSFRGCRDGFCSIPSFKAMPTRRLCSKASVFSEVSNQKQFFKVGAESTGPIPSKQLLQVVQTAAETGAKVVMDTVNKPRTIAYKIGLSDLVTDTDKMSEAAILDVVRNNFQDHLILGEEGGLIGDSSSDYLWCIDPLDGTTNFAHGYPSFSVSVAVLFRGKPAAATVGECACALSFSGYSPMGTSSVEHCVSMICDFGPWQFDKHVTFDGRSNKYTLLHNGKMMALTPLTPSQMYEDQLKLQRECDLDRQKRKQKGAESGNCSTSNLEHSAKDKNVVPSVINDQALVKSHTRKQNMIIKAKDVRKVMYSDQPLLLVICKYVLLNVDELDKALPSSVVALLQEFEDVFPDEIPDGLPLI
ncbi:uncharacterized protein LOC113782139 [Coffea eugenioides]|uniref:uncharacterized protein LOC113782139 n=1 Tax=Coffea eugenioides TaxID=49369 RepID=UPI000F60E95E|nr:uncharacterized protein LOC113782139 [Coffea eugenioides]